SASSAKTPPTLLPLGRRNDGDASVRHRVLEIATQCSASLPRPVAVAFSGPLDLLVTGPLADDVTAVAGELLTNAVKHAAADSVRLTVEARDEVVRVVVEDD